MTVPQLFGYRNWPSMGPTSKLLEAFQEAFWGILGGFWGRYKGIPHNPAEADKSEEGGDARQVGQEASRGAGRGAG